MAGIQKRIREDSITRLTFVRNGRAAWVGCIRLQNYMHVKTIIFVNQQLPRGIVNSLMGRFKYT